MSFGVNPPNGVKRRAKLQVFLGKSCAMPYSKAKMQVFGAISSRSLHFYQKDMHICSSFALFWEKGRILMHFCSSLPPSAPLCSSVLLFAPLCSSVLLCTPLCSPLAAFAGDHGAETNNPIIRGSFLCQVEKCPTQYHYVVKKGWHRQPFSNIRFQIRPIKGAFCSSAEIAPQWLQIQALA
ncbi:MULTISPECIES: hypothetical protein [Paenibacillus]|uniref:Uncharacterized protein n=1 Tax=Paenibacillus residui TaxID=629724 RepID=A0ABW3D7V4_9BACL